MTEESEREARAASEQRHRTANTFQLIGALARMRGQKSVDAEARRQLTWVADAVGTLGALERHRRGAGVDMGAFLEEMAPNWRRRHGTNAPELHLDLHPVLAADSAATSLALIAQELVGNAFSHAFPEGRSGNVTLRLAEVGPGRGELVVRDDGQGFDPASRGERFGLWFVRSLAAQVRGEFTLEQRLGVVARLRFEAQAA